MVARWWVRFAVWLRDGDGGDGGEAEWGMLFIICNENKFVLDCGKYKNRKKTITYYLVESEDKFSDPD